ncbi:putative adenylyl cyclase-associated protein [Paratrimastix pyriformis]|uniref:Adenylyl cyclase-associated protein n=1 Tax=Paratrimastix pyriformis TaxID=342808 RepID=A0ABQ8UH99_9EUKA|nr:putative adenylyl cyclase-associated protein [Paratrimastix pyriformis]
MELALTVENTKQAVSIFNCRNCRLTITGKANSISLEKCRGVQVAFPSVISSISLSDCQDCAFQAFEKLPCVLVDGCLATRCYLPPQGPGAETEIITAKSMSTTAIVPTPDGEDAVECGIPEQLSSKFKNGKMETNFVVSE